MDDTRRSLILPPGPAIARPRHLLTTKISTIVGERPLISSVGAVVVTPRSLSERSCRRSRTKDRALKPSVRSPQHIFPRVATFFSPCEEVRTRRRSVRRPSHPFLTTAVARCPPARPSKHRSILASRPGRRVFPPRV